MTSDVMLHGVLNMPLPDDPAECDIVTWLQFKQRAREASARIEQLAATNEELEAKLVRCGRYRDAYAECDRISVDRIEELEKRNASLEAVLREVDTWVDDLLPYAQEGHEPANVFKRVKEVLDKC